jgi:Lon protease-like protein
MAELPMFPLGTVLFPTLVLPLHVFEPRYRVLVERCLGRPEPEFGVVLIERGSEVGGHDVRSSIGTVARIVDSKLFDDGRWALAVAGVRRLQVLDWLPDDPHPRAEVEDWPEPEPDTPLDEAYADVATKLRRSLGLAAELGDLGSPATVDLTDDPVVGSYQASALAPVAVVDQQRLLSTPVAAERLQLLDELLTDTISFLELRLGEG